MSIALIATIIYLCYRMWFVWVRLKIFYGWHTYLDNKTLIEFLRREMNDLNKKLTE
jgi:hypothetical protein